MTLTLLADIAAGDACEVCHCRLYAGEGTPRTCTDCGGEAEPAEPDPMDLSRERRDR